MELVYERAVFASLFHGVVKKTDSSLEHKGFTFLVSVPPKQRGEWEPVSPLIISMVLRFQLPTVLWRVWRMFSPCGGLWFWSFVGLFSVENKKHNYQVLHNTGNFQTLTLETHWLWEQQPTSLPELAQNASHRCFHVATHTLGLVSVLKEHRTEQFWLYAQEVEVLHLHNLSVFF